jgi:hypothetical protein
MIHAPPLQTSVALFVDRLNRRPCRTYLIDGSRSTAVNYLFVHAAGNVTAPTVTPGGTDQPVILDTTLARTSNTLSLQINLGGSESTSMAALEGERSHAITSCRRL